MPSNFTTCTYVCALDQLIMKNIFSDLSRTMSSEQRTSIGPGTNSNVAIGKRMEADSSLVENLREFINMFSDQLNFCDIIVLKKSAAISFNAIGATS